MTSFGEYRDSEDDSLTGTNQFSFCNWLKLFRAHVIYNERSQSYVFCGWQQSSLISVKFFRFNFRCENISLVSLIWLLAM